MMRCLLTVLLVVAHTPARAQRIEVGPLVGRTTSAEIEETTDGVDDLTVDGGLTWGVRGTYYLTPRIGFEGRWTRRATAVSMDAASRDAELFTLSAHQAHGSLVYRFGAEAARLSPFVFGGLGATWLRSDEAGNDTAASWTAGGGLALRLQRHYGVDISARYTPAMPRDGASAPCEPFGFCQTVLRTFDVSAAAVVRF